jgi:hypothetical protein
MALVDMLEQLAASYNRGYTTLQFAACVLGLTSIKELLDLSVHFNVEFVGTNPMTHERLNAEERSLDGWRLASVRVDK